MKGRILLVVAVAALSACRGEAPPTMPSITFNPVININSQNNGGDPSGGATPAPGCGARKTAELGWSVEGGLLPNGDPVARFAQTAPRGAIVQFDFTPKDAAGPLPASCHGAIAYSTATGPCRQLTGSPDNFNPRVEITATSGVCQLRATVDGATATAEITAVQ